MNDPIDEFEVQMRRLKPSPPASLLADRIAEELSTRSRSIPARVPAWRAFFDRWLGPTPSLSWAIAAAAVVIAAITAATLLPTQNGDSSPTARLNDPSQGTTAAGSLPEAARVQFARAVMTPQAVHDDGLVQDESGALARRVRYEFTDTLEWRDAKSGTQVVVSFPREEIFSTPLRAF